MVRFKCVTFTVKIDLKFTFYNPFLLRPHFKQKSRRVEVANSNKQSRFYSFTERIFRISREVEVDHAAVKAFFNFCITPFLEGEIDLN
jgi:hypothetical protein